MMNFLSRFDRPDGAVGVTVQDDHAAEWGACDASNHTALNID